MNLNIVERFTFSIMVYATPLLAILHNHSPTNKTQVKFARKKQIPYFWANFVQTNKNKNMETTFGEYIKQKRIELGYPLRKVASHIDLDPSTLGKIEKDERQLNIEQFDNLCKVLKADKTTLLNYHYSTRIFDELKTYPEYREVLSIVNEQLTHYITQQTSIQFEPNWTEKDFLNPV